MRERPMKQLTLRKDNAEVHMAECIEGEGTVRDQYRRMVSVNYCRADREWGEPGKVKAADIATPEQANSIYAALRKIGYARTA